MDADKHRLAVRDADRFGEKVGNENASQRIHFDIGSAREKITTKRTRIRLSKGQRFHFRNNLPPTFHRKDEETVVETVRDDDFLPKLLAELCRDRNAPFIIYRVSVFSVEHGAVVKYGLLAIL